MMTEQSKLSMKSCYNTYMFILAIYIIINTIYFILNNTISVGFKFICLENSNLEIKFYECSTFLYLHGIAT